ncbi:MAG: hypothetical protein ACRDE8_03945, partial [Ginsengibacter sp.]
LLLQSMVSAGYAQKFEPVNPKTDKLEFHGYEIKLFPAFGNSYGYDILKGNELLVHQSHNPFTTSPIGLSVKEDVYKVAEWQINQSEIEKKSQKNISHLPGKPPTVENFFYKPVPAEVAKRLQIRISR